MIGTVPEGTAEDADRAVKAARAAFDSWSQTSAYERAALCGAIGAALAERGDELAALITTELGMPIGLSRMIQAGLPSLTFSSMPQLVEEIEWEEEVGNSLIVREAAGVVAAITPWNYPLHQIANKVAPALAAGCTVVLKPSEVVPLNAFVLAEVCEAVGLPGGVFNLVTGTGPVVGEAIVAHPETDMVSFTGSTRAGRRVSELAAQARQAGLAGAGRQVAERDPRRRRPRAGGHRRRGQVLPQLRPDLQRAHPHAGAARQARAGGADRRRGGRRGVHARATRSSTAARSARSCRTPSASACAATSRRARPRAPSS